MDSSTVIFGHGHDGYDGHAAAQVEEPSSFGPNLATLSMLSPVEMTLTPAEEAGIRWDAQSQFPAMVSHGYWVVM